MIVESKELIGLMNEIFQRDGYDLSTVNENEDLANYGMNSVIAVELVVKLESKFNITIDDDDLTMSNYTTVAKIRDLLKKY